MPLVGDPCSILCPESWYNGDFALDDLAVIVAAPYGHDDLRRAVRVGVLNLKRLKRPRPVFVAGFHDHAGAGRLAAVDDDDNGPVGEFQKDEIAAHVYWLALPWL